MSQKIGILNVQRCNNIRELSNYILNRSPYSDHLHSYIDVFEKENGYHFSDIQSEATRRVIHSIKTIERRILQIQTIIARDSYMIEVDARLHKELLSDMKKYNVKRRKKITRDITDEKLDEKKREWSDLKLEYNTLCKSLYNVLYSPENLSRCREIYQRHSQTMLESLISQESRNLSNMIIEYI